MNTCLNLPSDVLTLIKSNWLVIRLLSTYCRFLSVLNQIMPGTSDVVVQDMQRTTKIETGPMKVYPPFWPHVIMCSESLLASH